ncbi:His/Gly/Thr/Pro-type tRNA ligase C-terminal domain-containing protein, partial [Halomonas sp. SIMBA_159]
DKKPGWKFNETEMRGIPLRLEIGPKDIEQEKVVLVRRDTGEKIEVANNQIETEVARLLEEIQQGLYEKARMHRLSETRTV